MKFISNHLIAAALAAGLALVSTSAHAGFSSSSGYTVTKSSFQGGAVFPSFAGNIVTQKTPAGLGGFGIGSSSSTYTLSTFYTPSSPFFTFMGYTPVVVNGKSVTALPIFFSAVGAVPELEEYVMMLLGLGLIGYVATRRKQEESIAAYA